MNNVRVLITDDEIEICDMLKSVLEAQWNDYAIFVSHSGKEALSVLKDKEIDVLVTDIRMPGMSGIELMEKAREIQKDIRTIVLTGHGDFDNAVEALRLGANNYLRKPVSAEILHFAIMNAWEKVRLNRRLRESELQFRTMFERNSTPMFLIDPDTGSIMNANMAASRFYGYSIEELTAMNITQINMMPREKVHEEMQLVRCGRKEHLIFPHRLKSGEVRTVQVNSTPLEVNDRQMLFSVIHDIEERIRAEKALRDSERRYRTLFDNAGDAIFVHYFKGQMIDVNQVACERLGYAREELLQMTPKDFTLPKYAELIPDRLKALREKGHIMFETAHITRDNEIIPAEGSSCIVEYDGKKAVLTISRDIRERMKAEAEQEKLRAQVRQFQKMESVGTLAGGIAHDFNNILYPIIGYTEMSLEETDEARIRLNLEQILIASYRARDLIQQLLAFSRQSDGEQMPVKIQYIIKEAIQLLRATLPASIDIRQSIKDCGAVMADSGQIHQVIMNLCINASHAMRKNRGTLQVSLDETELSSNDMLSYPGLEPGSYLRLAVSDTGHGMNHKVMERIFDPYFTTKEKGRGTGLGLSVVHGIIKGHHGHITVDSEMDKGTCFHVYLPLITDRAVPWETVTDAPVPRGNEQILLVDDEAQIVEIGRQMLEKLGYKVTSRTSAVEALEAFRNCPEKFALVITDTTMPNMTGLELSREMLAIRPGIPIILCTGFSELVTEEAAKAMGIRHFVMKPVVRSEIANIIRKVLEEKC